MDNRATFIKDCVITIMADDYESFELIFSETKYLAARRDMDVSEGEVAEALRQVITEGYADAYVLSPQSPHSMKVEYAPDRLDELWFYVTPRGKHAAKSIPELSGEGQ